MKNKNNWYWLAIYAIVVALYNILFSLILIAVILLALYLLNWEIVTGLRSFCIFCYCLSYAILFITNIGVIINYIEGEENVKKDSLRKRS